MNTETFECADPMTVTLTPREQPPVVFVLYFAGGDGRFADVLGRWFEFYHASGCPWPVRLLTDLETSMRPIGHLVRTGAVFRADAEEHAGVIRPNNAFDRKSALICAALPRLPDRSIVVDLDAFFLRNPAAMLEPFTRMPFAMAEDAGGRFIHLAEGTIKEQSSSVMVFGRTEPDILSPRAQSPEGGGESADDKDTGWDPEDVRNRRLVLVAHYLRAWRELAVTGNQSALETDIREQRAWSVVKHRTGAPLLPRECNDSRFWKGPTASTLIYHAHGKEKFGQMART